VGSYTGDNVGDKIGDQVGSNLGNSVGENMGNITIVVGLSISLKEGALAGDMEGAFVIFASLLTFVLLTFGPFVVLAFVVVGLVALSLAAFAWDLFLLIAELSSFTFIF
jgi:hypothetical protein